MANTTNIPPPRVQLVDERTGMISREWYRYFFNQFVNASGGDTNITIENIDDEPIPGSSEFAVIDTALNALQSTPNLLDQVAALQKQLDELKLQIYPQLGTMAELQQANLPWVTFDTTPETVPTATTGTLYWNTDDNAKTLNLVMEDTGGVVQQIGEETYYRVKADSTISDGQVVMFTGTLGASGGLKAAPATGLTATQNELIMGVATQNIATNNWGYVTWFGEIRGVNTTGSLYGETWADGDILYYNPAIAGGLTKNVPTAPNPKVIVAAVVHAATNGILFVRPTFGSALGATDSNVQITSLANGDVLQYVSANSRWENTPLSSVAVSSFSAGTTGFTPSSPTSGAVTLGGTLNVANGGTGQTSYANGELLIGNSTGNTLVKATLTASTGISVTNGSGSITLTNTAPDQTVTLTGAGTTSISGTYPNFTITSADQYTGTVTSVNASGGTTGLSFSGGPITSSGTLTLSGTLAVANGGTGQTSYADGELLIGNSTGNTLTKATLTAGTGISIINGGGAITIAASATPLAAPATKTADFTVGASEVWLINNKSGSTCTVTLPAAASNSGRILTFQNYQPQLLVSASSDVVPLGGGSPGTAILAAVVGNWATMVSDGTNWIIMQDAPNNALLIE